MVNTLVPIAGALDFTKCERIVTTRARRGLAKIAEGTALLDTRARFGGVTLMYNGAEIVRFYSNGSIQLFVRPSTCTRTTIQRVNQFSPYKIYMHEGKLYHLQGEPLKMGDIIDINSTIQHILS